MSHEDLTHATVQDVAPAGAVRLVGPAVSRVLLVGAGRRGLCTHVPAVAEVDSLALAAVVEITDPLAVFGDAPRPAVPFYRDVEAGIGAVRPDLAIVATPHDDHVSTVVRLLEAGIPTLVEKPPAMSVGELQQLIDISDLTGAPATILLPLRSRPDYKLFAGLLNPELADSEVEIHADVPAYPGIGKWREVRERAGGGVLFDLGYHYADLLVAHLGLPEVEFADLYLDADRASDVETEAYVSLWYDRQRIRIKMSLRCAPGIPKRHHVSIKGDSATMRVITDKSRASDLPVPPGVTRSPNISATVAQLRTLVDTGFLNGAGNWRTILRQQIDVMVLLDRIYATARYDTRPRPRFQ